jgi:hypothetical protein
MGWLDVRSGQHFICLPPKPPMTIRFGPAWPYMRYSKQTMVVMCTRNIQWYNLEISSTKNHLFAVVCYHSSLEFLSRRSGLARYFRQQHDRPINQSATKVTMDERSILRRRRKQATYRRRDEERHKRRAPALAEFSDSNATDAAGASNTPPTPMILVRPNKNARLMMASSHSNNHNNSNAIFEDDGLVGSILSFLPLSFRFTAFVNRRFQRCYRQVHHGHTSTSFWHCIFTVATAEIWLAETRRANQSSWEKVRACNVAARFGRLEVLQYLKEQGCHWSKETCTLAAVGGHLLLLQWMRTTTDRWGRCPWDEQTCVSAVFHGHLHILQWARANGCNFSKRTGLAAVFAGNLHILQWAIANGCDWDMNTCTEAAKQGHLHILQWARANGCDWNEWTCLYAAQKGHLHILQWAIANGCEWDVQGCTDFAHSKGHRAVVEWIDTVNIRDTDDDDDDDDDDYSDTLI